jgi:hypothetical protein
MLQDGNCKRCGASKTKQSNPIARLDTGDTQAPKSDDPRAEQRGNLRSVEFIR